jgi:hypothetical protein
MWEAIQRFVPHPNETEPIPGTWPAFEHCWSNFLHEFFYWRLTDFFAVPPHPEMEDRYRVMLAGAAEYLCQRYDLKVPEWVYETQYYLPELDDFWGFLLDDTIEAKQRRASHVEPEFRSRNLIFEARNLITI